MLQQRDSGESMQLPVARPATPDIETSLYFWHPNRFGVHYAPAAFRRQLHSIHSDLDVTWHPVKERWLVWYRRPRIQHAMCPGWMLLFVVEDSEERYVPLDSRVLAAVFERSGFKWGSGKAYWARVEQESQREQEARDATHEQDVMDAGADHWDHTKIQVSMCGPSSGSKFVNHHAGD